MMGIVLCLLSSCKCKQPEISNKCEQPESFIWISKKDQIIELSPTDDDYTVTATLSNGNSDDIYDFTWWADSYDRINMKIVNNQVIISPLSIGQVILHCSHPKAMYEKTILIYITNDKFLY